MKIILLLVSLLKCLDDVEFRIALELKRMIEEKMNKKEEGHLIEISKRKVCYIKIVWSDEGIKTSEISMDYLDQDNEKDSTLTIRGHIVGDFKTHVKEIYSFMVRAIGDDTEEIKLILLDHRKDRNINMDAFKEEIDLIFTRPLFNKLGKPVLSTISSRYPFSVISSEYVEFKYKIFENSTTMYFFSLYMPVGSSEVQNIIKQIRDLFISHNIKKYTDTSMKYNGKYISNSQMFNEIPYRSFPPHFHFKDSSREEMDKELELFWNSFSSTSHKNVLIHTSLTKGHYTDVYRTSSQKRLRGIGILLCHILENEDLFCDIMGKSDGVLDTFYHEVSTKILNKLLGGKDFTNKLHQDFFKDSRKNSVKLFDLLKDKVFENDPASLKPFIVLFYINCCDYFKFDLLDVIRKMSEDYVDYRIVKTHLTDEEVTHIFKKVLSFLSIPPTRHDSDLLKDDHNNAMEAFIRTYCIHQDDISNLYDNFKLLNMFELEDKILVIQNPFFEEMLLDLW